MWYLAFASREQREWKVYENSAQEKSDLKMTE
jgi:hypothetical protein